MESMDTSADFYTSPLRQKETTDASNGPCQTNPYYDLRHCCDE